jgi:aminoglycoside phosphotransferase family enzyme/predicted kinase
MSVSQPKLIASLCRLLAPAGDPQVIETHISVVILAGDYAYKIKKPVNLGFVDFSTLERRRHFCEEEIRLNRRLAPGVYLDVVAITGTEDAPSLGGDGDAIEYAVRMRAFAQDALATEALQRREIGRAFIDDLAVQVANFHAQAKTAAPRDAVAHTDAILELALRNFERMRPAAADPARVRELCAWTRAEFARRAPAMTERLAQARVRECHGDLHLGNIAVIDDRPAIFDCIEFNDELRFIDVMSEIAFLVIDLRMRGRTDLAFRFLNAYLELTGDYDGLRVLPFYLVYRAMVRAMVACERAAQLGAGVPGDEAVAQAAAYFKVAQCCAQPANAAIIVTHGFSGSGKTTGSQLLLEALPGVRMRTDVERKRLHGLRPDNGAPAGLDASMYAQEVTLRTYRHLLALARTSVTAGFAAIADGTFLRHWQRKMFRDLAAELRTPFTIISFKAREASLRARIEERAHAAKDASDASLEVLDRQLAAYDPLAADELAFTIAVDTERPDIPWTPHVIDEVSRQRSHLLGAA